MKLPITDKFLWDLYNAIEGFEKAYDTVSPPRSVSQYLYRDVIQLRKEYKRRKARRSFSQFISYLQMQGYIKVKSLEGVKGFMLTPKGTEKALQVKRKLKERKKRKDGKWIMIIFDIPEERRKARDFLRDALIDLGYQQVQKSVWVCPYDVYDETEEAIREYQIIPYVRLFLIEEIS
ncbi:MAG TPA: CRISPR-associated endonuclease Cas2 [Candidatus Paceibacterota bacterium]